MVFFILALLLAVLCGYLLGSVNTAILISHAMFGQDVRTLGSGNAGMTNVLRNFGKKGAVLTLLGDVAKGILAVLCGRLAVLWLGGGADVLYGAYVAAIAAILGHMFPIFFGFKGGKGVAVSCGVILALQPVLALMLVGVFLLVLFASKMVSLGSVIAISLYPAVTFLWCYFGPGRSAVFSTLCAAVVAVLVVWMHRENIGRILRGTEYKFGQKKGE